MDPTDAEFFRLLEALIKSIPDELEVNSASIDDITHFCYDTKLICEEASQKIEDSSASQS